MAYALIANTGDNDGANTVTTDTPFDTTGATLIVLIVSWYNGVAAPTISDSKGNTWTALTASNAAFTSTRIYYCVSPTVGSNHTFTATCTGAYPFIGVQAWSGNAASPFDQQNGGTSAASETVQPGSVTPTEDNELIVTSCGEGPVGGSYSINSGFTITNSVVLTAGTCEGGGMAYLVQTTASAVNPTWDNSGGTGGWTAAIATFKAAATGGIPRIVHHRKQQRAA